MSVESEVIIKWGGVRQIIKRQIIIPFSQGGEKKLHRRCFSAFVI